MGLQPIHPAATPRLHPTQRHIRRNAAHSLTHNHDAVDRIATHRYSKRGPGKARLEFLVYWLGYDQPTWIPASNVSLDLLDDYRTTTGETLPLFQARQEASRRRHHRGGKCND